MKLKCHRTSVIVVHHEKILGFYAEDPTSKEKYFFLPGGKIELGETIEAAAIRETLEETGYKIEILQKPRCSSQYDFLWDGRVHDCTTEFLVGHLLSEHQEQVDDAHYHRGVGWVKIEDLTEVFSYSSAILMAIKGLLLSRAI